MRTKPCDPDLTVAHGKAYAGFQENIQSVFSGFYPEEVLLFHYVVARIAPS
jgi:hypothetical protein